MFLGVSGLYSFWGKHEECIYVGKADCLMSRIQRQMNRFDYAESIVVEPISIQGLGYLEVKQLLRIREAMLIELENPIENICRPKWRNLSKAYPSVKTRIQNILDTIALESPWLPSPTTNL